jgi:hypothetical protein
MLKKKRMNYFTSPAVLFEGENFYPFQHTDSHLKRHYSKNQKCDFISVSILRSNDINTMMPVRCLSKLNIEPFIEKRILRTIRERWPKLPQKCNSLFSSSGLHLIKISDFSNNSLFQASYLRQHSKQFCDYFLSH